MLAPLAVTLLALTLAQSPQTATDLEAVHALYAAASYEDVLTRLSRLDPADVSPELEQYRAMCLLALGRQIEAEAAFDRLVRRAPLFTLAESEISPRIFGVFRETRRRVLPSVARDLYAKGKTSFDEKRYSDASMELRELMRVLNDPELASQTDTFIDLRQLAAGFIQLAEIEIARAEAEARAAAEVPAPPVQADATPETVPPSAPAFTVYSRDDRDVTPPVEIERTMPPWNPPSPLARSGEFHGVLEIIVDESGRVEGAHMLRPTVALYDRSLVDQAMRWRFEPALRDGRTVKYRLWYQVVLGPRS